jgi:cyclopropane fatty-acyl-phospholipid synthase-like methyltransferase
VNRDSYNAIAADWDAARVCFRGRERDYLDALLEGLAAGSQVLDLGCGTGRPLAEYVLARGYRLTGVDQAEELLELARLRFPDAIWVHSRIESFVSAIPFKAIICWDALFHIDRSQHEALFARFAKLLEPRGRLMLTFGGSDHPAFTDQMFGQTFFYDSHPPERALALLDKQGFVPIISEFTDLPTGGRDKGRYAVVAQLA